MRLSLGVKTFANDILTVFTFLIYMLVCDVSATSWHKRVLYVATKCDTVDIYEWTSTAGIHSRFQCHKFQYLPFNVWIKNKEARKNKIVLSPSDTRTLAETLDSDRTIVIFYIDYSKSFVSPSRNSKIPFACLGKYGPWKETFGYGYVNAVDLSNYNCGHIRQCWVTNHSLPILTRCLINRHISTHSALYHALQHISYQVAGMNNDEKV